MHLSGFGAAYIEARSAASTSLPAMDFVRADVHSTATGDYVRQYMLTVTPEITSVEPRTSGNHGGHSVTFTGSGLGVESGAAGCGNADAGGTPGVTAMLGGVPCTVTECSQTKLVCTVAAAPAPDDVVANHATSIGMLVKEWTGVSSALDDLHNEVLGGDFWDRADPDVETIEVGALSLHREPFCQRGIAQTKRGYDWQGKRPHDDRYTYGLYGDRCCHPDCRTCGDSSNRYDRANLGDWYVTKMYYNRIFVDASFTVHAYSLRLA